MTKEFRKSLFVDFNEGSVPIPPMAFMRMKKAPWTLPAKIDIFECLVEVWQLSPAVEILKQIASHDLPSAWSHSAYALIAVTFSYFERIGKTLNPNSAPSHTASIDFNYGFCDVYPQYAPTGGDYSNRNLPLVPEYRDRIRNGIYHLALTKIGLVIHNLRDVPDDFDTIGTPPTIYRMNPHRVTRTIVDHFPTFVARLRDPDPAHDQMRAKFEEFFDDFHKP